MCLDLQSLDREVLAMSLIINEVMNGSRDSVMDSKYQMSIAMDSHT